jgi:hypothetical protein
MVKAVGNSGKERWLEPSFGLGVFLHELNKAGVEKNSITAIDLETQVSPADDYGSVSRGVDFLEWCHRTPERFSRIVANPPYVSILDLPDHARTAARNLVLPSGSGRLPARSNLWAAFILGAVKLLKKGGAMSFVLPAAWEYADYAESIRNEVPSMFRDWHCFRCEEPVFPDVSEGSVVIVGRGFGEAHAATVRISCLRLEDLVAQISRLKDETSLSSTAVSVADPVRGAGDLLLADLVDIRLGGVSGDVGYFLLTESRRKELKLPVGALKPVLTKANHLRKAVVDRVAWEKLRDADARVWLFRPSGKICEHAAVQKYLELPTDQGGCNRQAKKVKNREPWYQVPLPRVIDGFLSGMCNHGPWIALNGMPGLSATNTLYTVSFKRPVAQVERAALALALLSTPVRSQLAAVCRRYAAGLAKFEPGDLQRLHIPQYEVRENPTVCYRRAISELLNGSAKTATRIADDCLRARRPYQR